MKCIIILLFVFVFSICSSYGQEIVMKCKATTTTGKQCSRKVVKDGYCKQHYQLQTGQRIPSKPKIDLPEEWPLISTNEQKPDQMIAWRNPVTNVIHVGFKH